MIQQQTFNKHQILVGYQLSGRLDQLLGLIHWHSDHLDLGTRLYFWNWSWQSEFCFDLAPKHHLLGTVSRISSSPLQTGTPVKFTRLVLELHIDREVWQGVMIQDVMIQDFIIQHGRMSWFSMHKLAVVRSGLVMLPPRLLGMKWWVRRRELIAHSLMECPYLTTVLYKEHCQIWAVQQRTMPDLSCTTKNNGRHSIPELQHWRRVGKTQEHWINPLLVWPSKIEKLASTWGQLGMI